MIFATYGYEYEQLPLERHILKTFPKIGIRCFFIANKESKLVIHEMNSKFPIDVGTYADLINSSEAFSLHDIALKFEHIAEHKIQRFKNLSIIFMHSDKSGYGCVASYKNQNNCEFIIAMFGFNSYEMCFAAIVDISNWLEQFYVFVATKADSFFGKIPILYGHQDSIKTRVLEDHIILMSHRAKPQIKKFINVLDCLKAPFGKTCEVGKIIYKTTTFEKPIIKNVYTNSEDTKANIFKVVKDSMKYIFCGTTAND